MGLRGPAPTPTSLLKLRGSWRGDENPNEPQAEVSAPDCPSFLVGEALAEWKRIVPQLLQRRTLSTGDLAMLASYCQAWGEFCGAAKRVNQLDSGKKKYKGLMIDHPRVVLGRAFERLTKAAQQFGLSPSSKSRIQAQAGEQPKSDGKSRFFRAG